MSSFFSRLVRSNPIQKHGKRILKNTSTKWQSNLIEMNAAYMLLSSQTLDQVKHWQIFIDDGQDQWMSVLDCPQIIQFFKTLPVEHAILSDLTVEMAEVVASSETVRVEDEFIPVAQETPVNVVSEDELKGAERRMHPRFDIRLRVIIKSGKNTYLTFTKDVSLGGLSLMNDVPEYIFNSEAEIYITGPDQKNNIMFICSPVPSKLGKSRLMFTRVEESKQKLLDHWLNNIIKPAAKNKTLPHFNRTAVVKRPHYSAALTGSVFFLHFDSPL